MASKTISLSEEAYAYLVSARDRPGESFTQVILRAVWPHHTPTGQELLTRLKTRGAILDEDGIGRVEQADQADTPEACKRSEPTKGPT